MILTEDSQFIVTEKSTGRKYYTKGLYWHKKNLVLIAPREKVVDKAARLKEYPIRLSVPAKEYEVEVL